MRSIKHIYIHHTASPQTTTVDTIRRWHTSKGWSDVGYHVVIRRGDGGFWLAEAGRPASIAGAHVKGDNAESLGVAICGRYHPGDGDDGAPPDAALDLAAEIVSAWCRDLGLDPLDAVKGHKEFHGAATVCPGDHFDMPDFQARVLRRMDPSVYPERRGT